MTTVDIAGWVCTAAVLGSYAHLARTGRSVWFDWANAVGCVGIGLSAFAHHAYPSVVITAAFGVIGWYSLRRRWVG